MNEQEFAKWVLDKVKKDEHLFGWYGTKLQGTKLEETVHTIVYGMHQSEGLTFEDAVILSIFIGITTKAKLEELIKQ